MLRTFTPDKLVDKIRYQGRVYKAESGSVHFNWSASGMTFRYYGRVLTGHFLSREHFQFDETVNMFRNVWPYAAVYLDGEETPHRVFTVDQLDQDEIIFSSDKKEDHEIRIVKLTENFKTYLGLDSFCGDGEFLPLRSGKKPLLEIVGDSNSAAFGVTSLDPERMYYSCDQDATKSYGYLTAKALGMDVNIVAISGICASLKNPGNIQDPMDIIYPYTDYHEDPAQRWDFKHHTPEYIVINLGTNDEGVISLMDDPDEGEDQFIDGYVGLLQEIRECNGRHPKIICTLGDYRYYLNDAIEKAVDIYIAESGDEKVFFMKMHRMVRDVRRGAVGHPPVSAHEKMAKQLTEYIRKLMNEE